MAKKRNNGFLRPYRTYNFLEKDPVIDQVRTHVEATGGSYAAISEKSGVSVSTMYNWFHGKTRRPQFATVEAVGRACGRTLVWKKL